MPDINGIPYVESGDLVSAYPTVSQDLAQEVSDQLASKLPYSYGTATPSTSDDGFLWYDSNSTPPEVKFWDGAAFQALSSGKILQVVRATDGTERTTTSTSFVDLTGLSVTITPTKSTSAVLLVLSVLVLPANPSSKFQISDSSNNALSGAEDSRIGVGAGQVPIVLLGYSTPATTSATTYKARFAASAGTNTARNNINTGQLYALEIGA